MTGKYQLHEGRIVPNNKVILIEGLSDDEKKLVIAGLRALRRDRGKVWNSDCDAAESEGKRPPGIKKYGIDEIKRLARRFGGKALHSSEYQRSDSD